MSDPIRNFKTNVKRSRTFNAKSSYNITSSRLSVKDNISGASLKPTNQNFATVRKSKSFRHFQEENDVFDEKTVALRKNSFYKPGGLNRQKSFSEGVLNELVTSPLFLRQSFLNTTKTSDNSNVKRILKKWNSRIKVAEDVARNEKNAKKEKEEYENLLKTINTSNNEQSSTHTIRKFPVTAPSTDTNENELGIDEKDVIRRTNVYRQSSRSKTYNFDGNKSIGASNDVTFKVVGLSSINVNREQRKLHKDEHLLYERNDFYIVKENKKHEIKKQCIDFLMEIKSIKVTGKREVELKLSDKKNDSISNYLLTFDSSKEMKNFVELPEIQNYIDKSSVRNRLYRLLYRRPSLVDLKKKGIYQNETIFDNNLKTIYENAKGVPKFIGQVIEIIERPENINSLGLYRAPGNLATIQKIRTEIDKGMLNILQEYAKDVDVLTGCLKLFFRELKEPLISLEVSEALLEIVLSQDAVKKDKVTSILKTLPEAHLETLVCLFRHLLEVEKCKDQNKMDIYNLAVCWAPTITFIQYNSKDIIKQSTDATKVVEFLLNYYKNNLNELNSLKRPDWHESKESLASGGSTNSLKRRPVVVNDRIFDVVKKLVDLIEQSPTPETLYQKSGSMEKISKILKKIQKNKLADLEKYKSDSHELADALKRFVRELPEPLLPKSAFERYCQICDKSSNLLIRREMLSMRDKLPHKDAIIYLLKHIKRLQQHNELSKEKNNNLINNWSVVFSYNQNVTDMKKYVDFLNCLISVCDASVTTPTFASTNEKHFDSLMPDLVQQIKDSGRIRRVSENNAKERVKSTYDNLDTDDDVRGEASILDDKTEYTKL